MRTYILTINPGSTSTKVALFNEESCIHEGSLTHSAQELEKYPRIADQYEMRKEIILSWIQEKQVGLSDLKAVVGRGGLLRPMPGGTYEITEPMLADLRIGYQAEHASNLGGIIAKAISDEAGVKAYLVDPVAVDEFIPEARISGLPEIKRRALGHALNIKAVGHRIADTLGKKFEEVNLLVAHLGGGITIAPVRRGKLIDYNNANEMGPFSPERAGGLPVGALVELAFSGKYTQRELGQKIRGKGGLTAYLGTNDARVVEAKIQAGDEQARLVFSAMAYQIAKEIGAMATVLEGQVDAIVLTGGLAYSKRLTEEIMDRIGFIAPVTVYPGEDELDALNRGALRVLRDEEKAKIYENEVDIRD